MDNELEVIRTEMEETRSSLADKLEELGNQFRGTVEGATEAVANTVETVQGAVETVRETFDVRKHVARHPWLMLGAAVTVGYIGGRLLLPPRQPSEQEPAPGPTGEPVPFTPQRNGHARRAQAEEPQAPREEGPFHEALQMLKGLAVGSLMGVLRETLTRSLPSNLVDDAGRLVDDLTRKLGGKPLDAPRPGDKQANEPQGSETKGETSNGKRNQAEMGRTLGTAEGQSEKPVGQRHRRRAAPG